MPVRNALAVAVLCFLAVGATPQNRIPVVNVMTTFWSFWDSTQGQPESVRVAQFKEQVIVAGLPVYADGQFRLSLADDVEIGKYLASLQPIIPQMRVVSKKVEEQWPLVEANIAKQLPDLSPDGIIVYFLPSFNHFIGQTRQLGDKTGVLFGVDKIVQYEGVNANVGVNIAHELFHVYQGETHPELNGNDTPPLWLLVWIEGSAAYASQVLTPGATMHDALAGTDLADAKQDTVKGLACGIKANWSSHDEKDDDLYIDTGNHPQGLPAHGGYLIGYLVTQDLAKTQSIGEIGKYNFTTLEPVMRAEVGKLCVTGTL